VCQFGPLSPWMNNYFGGEIAGVAGCLVFGALPRYSKEPRLRYALVLGAGLGLGLLARPFESIFLASSVVLYPALQKPIKTFALIALGAAPAVGVMLLHNHAVSGNWTTFPYTISRNQYGIPTTFTFEANPIPHRVLTPEQRLDYEVQAAVHGDGHDTLRRYLRRLLMRIGSYRYFFYPSLYIPLIAFLTLLRVRRIQWLVLTVVIFMAGTNVYPYFYPHYVAALTSVFLLMSVLGLKVVHQWKPWLAGVVLAACAGQFLFWYGVHLYAEERFMRLNQFPPNYINWGDPEGRDAVQERLNAAPGKQLVFVRREEKRGSTWVHNAADIDNSQIVWARDLGPAENEELKRYYKDRTVWLLEPDLRPPRLTRYPTSDISH